MQRGNPAGRRHEVAAPWSTALRYSTDLHCIHAFAMKCSDSWAFFSTTMSHTSDFWLDYRGRLRCTYQTSAESVKIASKTDELWGARHAAMIALARYYTSKSTELQSWWRMRVEHWAYKMLTKASKIANFSKLLLTSKKKVRRNSYHNNLIIYLLTHLWSLDIRIFVIRHVSDHSRLQPDHCVVGLAAVSKGAKLVSPARAKHKLGSSTIFKIVKNVKIING